MKVSEDFIRENFGSDPSVLRLKYLSNNNISSEERLILENSILQIECRKKFKNKLSSLLSRCPEFIFPSYLSGEQASHNWVACQHARIAKSITDKFPSQSQRDIVLLDMTAGLGLDFIMISSSLSLHGDGCVAIELDPDKCIALRENLNRLGLYEASVLTADSLDYLKMTADDSISILFIDPARRGTGNSRIFDPEDCQPDIVANWDMILRKADHVMVKLSSMLDLHQIIRLLPGISNIVVISVRNECKEILIIARRKCALEEIDCINILYEGEHENLSFNEFKIFAEDLANNLEIIPLAGPTEIKKGLYLYEPNSSVMKTMAWNSIYNKFGGLKKLSKNCHLFISEVSHADFPGRILKIEEIIDRNRKKSLKGSSLNVVTRNYPQKAEDLAKSLRLKGSQDKFLYGMTAGIEEKPMLVLASL